MKQIVRYRFMTIPNKMTGEIRLTINSERNNEYTSQYEGGKSTNISIFPIISINIVKPHEEGVSVRANWDPNESIGLTKFNLPVFLSELEAIQEAMKIPTLYQYTDNRLELNEKEAMKIRKVFMVGTNMTVELAPIVIEKDEGRIEGIKVKFNTDLNVTTLTLNELTAVIYSLRTLPVDVLTLQLYTAFINRQAFARTKGPSAMAQYQRPIVDMTPYMGMGMGAPMTPMM